MKEPTADEFSEPFTTPWRPNEQVTYLPHYYSTSCLHDRHDECKGVCKFCPEKCRCRCHREKS